ncbi:hypothetical protein DSM107010_42390 [Chroococcidiopsis cubana SAG 39.79]|uniref:Uncharacterized protein n=1 Tax=Chroococcidiopsis cubana SAG 39.79 TaxID=388085 RepID=A0AB37UFT7_9CYAN|nr:hypothetical protein DSM107010_42390 [Chroococcidiopsis cubana SAG 39.79]
MENNKIQVKKFVKCFELLKLFLPSSRESLYSSKNVMPTKNTLKYNSYLMFQFDIKAKPTNISFGKNVLCSLC